MKKSTTSSELVDWITCCYGEYYSVQYRIVWCCEGKGKVPRGDADMSERKVSRLWLHIGPVCTCSARRRSVPVRLAVLNWSFLILRLCTCQSYQPKHRRYLRRPTPLLAPECHPRNRPDQCVAIQTRILVIYPKHSVNFQKIVQILVQIPYCAFFLIKKQWDVDFLVQKTHTHTHTHTHTEPDHCRRSKNKSPLIARFELIV